MIWKTWTKINFYLLFFELILKSFVLENYLNKKNKQKVLNS